MKLTRKVLTSPHLAIFALTFGLTANSAWSQATSSSTVAGLVTDEQNAAVVGAEVRLIDLGTGSNQATLTNETGRYVLVNLSPGTYSVTVTKQGFAAFRIS